MSCSIYEIIGILAVCILSESMPFLKIKCNGILHFIYCSIFNDDDDKNIEEPNKITLNSL